MSLEQTILNPLVHTFKTDRNYYLYDAGSNEIIKTDLTTYHLFNGKINIGGVNPKEKKERDFLIEKLVKRGIFSMSKFNGMGFSINNKEIKNNLEGNIQEMILNITEDCNFRCRYCAYSGLYQYHRVHSKKFMSEKIAKNAVDYFDSVSSKSSILYLGFYGGEPLLCWDMIKSLVLYSNEKFKDKEKFWAITTNGSLIKKDKLDFFVSHNIILNVSLDGPEGIHDKNRVLKGEEPTFREIYNNLKVLKEYNRGYYNKRVNFSVTLCPANNLLEIKDFFSNDELVKDHIYFISNIDPFDTYFFKIYPLNKEDINRFDHELSLLRKEYIRLSSNGEENKFFTSLFRKKMKLIHHRRMGAVETIKPNGACIPGLKRIFVSTDGKFYPCERVGESFNIGDINNGLDHERILKIIEEYSKKSREYCINCWASRFCNLCLSSSRKGEEISIERKRERCKDIKENVKKDLETYCSILENNPAAFDGLTPLWILEDR